MRKKTNLEKKYILIFEIIAQVKRNYKYLKNNHVQRVFHLTIITEKLSYISSFPTLPVSHDSACDTPMTCCIRNASLSLWHISTEPAINRFIYFSDQKDFINIMTT